VQSTECAALSEQLQRVDDKDVSKIDIDELGRPGFTRITMSLLHRLFIKSYRDVVAYGIRIVMYMGIPFVPQTIFNSSELT
jgi:hypothetical protein